MLFASKYLVPILWLPLIYYDVFRFGKEPRWRIDRRTWILILAAFLMALLICNPIVLSPDMWEYAWSHFKHERLAHSGYLFMDQLELNKAYHTFWGTPVYFYPLYLFVKTPILLLVLLCAGLWFTLRRIRDSRFFFLGLYFFLWLFLLSLPGGKFTRYAITWLPAVILLEALGIYIVYSIVRSHIEKRFWPRQLRAWYLRV